MNSNNMWMVIAIVFVAALASGATFVLTKSHYSSPQVTVRDTVTVTVRNTDTVKIVMWPKVVRDTVRLPGNVIEVHDFATVDTTMPLELEVTAEDVPPILTTTLSSLSISYDIMANRYSLKQSLSSVKVELPVVTKTNTFVVEKNHLFWIQPSVTYQGNSPGGGLTFGVTRYSLGRKWSVDYPPTWELGVRFDI